MNFGIPALVLNGVAFLLEVIGLSIPYWLFYRQYDDSVLVEVNVGLWTGCYNNLGQQVHEVGLHVCASLSDDYVIILGVSERDSLDATRAMVAMAAILLVGALGCLVLKMFVLKQEKNLPRVAAIVAIVGGVCGIIGCIIFAAKFSNYKLTGKQPVKLKLHASFGLCIVASVMGIVSGILAFLIRENYQSEPIRHTSDLHRRY